MLSALYLLPRPQHQPENLHIRMAKHLPSVDHVVDEDYIDMDISSTTFLCYTKASPPRSREFEFHMSATPLERQPVTSPADELFYKGKLLPLHLPPRLKMVESITTDSNGGSKTAATTPFESCNISPATSCYVSGELDSEDYFFECSVSLVESNRKKSWSKKLKLIKHSLLGHKLKASKAYLRSLFSKSGCSDESTAGAKAKECSNGYPNLPRKNPFGPIQRERNPVAKNINGEKMAEEICSHRRSFSSAIKWHSSNKSSSESSSCTSSNSSSNGVVGIPMLKRSSSANSEAEISIKGAIAYCKKSQQLVAARKSVSEAGLCSIGASRIALSSENKENSELDATRLSQQVYTLSNLS